MLQTLRMKSILPISLLWLSPWAILPAHATNGCNDDNCARAVTGTRRGTAFPTVAKSDCQRFMAITKFGHTTTITAAASVTSTTKEVPSYASACSGSSRYTSACSCWGVTSSTVSKANQTTTITVSPSAVTSGPAYTPSIPSSYDACIFDPSQGAAFEFLDPNGLAIVDQGGKAVEASDPYAPVDPFTFSHPQGAPTGYDKHTTTMTYMEKLVDKFEYSVFDIVLDSGGKQLFFAIFKSGAVGFVESSSNGQSYAGSGDPYITTIWSVACDGLATAGILGGVHFQFVIQDNKEIIATASQRARKTRDISVPEGFYVNPQVTPTAPGSQCPSPLQHATTKNPPLPVTSNGCGPEGFWGYFVPDFEFVDACNFHDVCWADCSASFTSCNAEFRSRMLATCTSKHDAGSFLYGVCSNLANFYYAKVSGNYAAKHFTETAQKYCDCKCNDESLAACGDKCVDTKTDADNCGNCNFHCPTNSCTNGACSFNSCQGQTCSSFGPCGPGGSCVCASVTGGTGFCVDGETPCAGLASCGTSADCPLGAVCAVGTCCGQNVCITTDVCGGFNLPRQLFAPRRAWTNATVGHVAGYVS